MSAHATGKRIALLSMLASALLAAAKIALGILAGSTSVVADGVESAGDVLASGIVMFGLMVAARPPDENHPYGHGRFETLAGLAVGMLLAVTGTAICVGSLDRIREVHPPPAGYAFIPLLVSITVKGALSAVKFRYGRRLRSEALVADAWNDTVDILSGVVALCAVGLTLYDPARFLIADHVGGCAVGLIVIFLGLRVARETTLHLVDTMPEDGTMDEIRRIALTVPGALDVEKCFARRSGLQYHVDLHLEVDPDLTVRASHGIATAVRIKLKETLPYVADVLVHVEPHPVEPTIEA
jgi:cation diffusion facilitator family transporter